MRPLPALMIAVFVVFTLAASSTPAQVAGAGDARPPNIVIVFADDLGWGDLSCYGQASYETPHLDRMAAEGVRLTDFYVSVPYCAPSRAALLTGRYPFRTGVTGNPAPDGGNQSIGIEASEVTLAEALATRGYASCCIGKWHLGHLPRYYPRRHGFEEYYGILYSNDMRPVVLVENELVVEYPIVQSFLTEKYTDRAIDFIERHRDRPFFLYLPHAMPHKPLAASEEFYTPETLGDLYADVLRELDASVGRIFETLRRLELDEDTLVIFTSDNGPWYGGSTGGLRGMKGSTWEGGLRVPMIARWPGKLPQGVTRSQPCATIDFFPTICRLSGVTEFSADHKVDGVDIFGVLAEGAPAPDRALFGFLGNQVSTVRKGRWKLHVRAPRQRPRWTSPERWIDPRGPDGTTIIAPFEQAQPTAYPSPPGGDAGRAGMLCDLEIDAREQKDVASQHPEIVEELSALARRLAQEMRPVDRPRGPRISKGPGFVSPDDPLPLDAVLHPATLGSPQGRRPNYDGLETADYLEDVRVLATIEDRAVFTEGPAVDRAGNVFFTNVPASKILLFDPHDGTLTTYRENTSESNGLLFDARGRLLACEGGAGRLTRTERDGSIEILAEWFGAFPFAPPNDLCLDRHGRIYFTSRPGPKNPEAGNLNAVYRIDPEGNVARLLAFPRVHMPNGIVLSPDERTLYLIEAHPDAFHHRDLRAFDLKPDGSIENERVLVDFYPGRSGDGMAIDAEGNLYVAAGLHARRDTSETLDTRPGIHVFSPDGVLLAFRQTPEDTITNCTFGGEDLRTLYVTCGTKLIAIRTRIPGKPSYRPEE